MQKVVGSSPIIRSSPNRPSTGGFSSLSIRTGWSTATKGRVVIDTVTGWESTQGQTDDGAVESEQRVLLDAPAVAFDRVGAARLGERYWVEVRGTTHGLVRSRMRGDRLQLRILGRGP